MTVLSYLELKEVQKRNAPGKWNGYCTIEEIVLYCRYGVTVLQGGKPPSFT